MPFSTTRIEEMFAFVAVDPFNSTEGVTGMQTSMGWMPMVGADMDRVDSLRAIAQDIATVTGREIRILKFSLREEIGTIVPMDVNKPNELNNSMNFNNKTP